MSGLMAIKSCLEEGVNPVCFEQHGQIGMVINLKSVATLIPPLAVDRHTITLTSNVHCYMLETIKATTLCSVFSTNAYAKKGGGLKDLKCKT